MAMTGAITQLAGNHPAPAFGSAGAAELAVRDARAGERLAPARGTSVVPVPIDPATCRGLYG